MTKEHRGDCGTGSQHRDLVLMLRVPEDNYDVALAMLQMVRSGLTCNEFEPEVACGSSGPFEVRGEDRVLLTAIADDAEGHIDALPEEPHLIRERDLLRGVRLLTLGMMPVPAWDDLLLTTGQR